MKANQRFKIKKNSDLYEDMYEIYEKDMRKSYIKNTRLGIQMLFSIISTM